MNLRMPTWSAITLMSVGILLSACSQDNPVEPDVVMLADVQSQVFDASCAVSGCHAGDDPAGALNLTSGASFDALVNVPSTEVPELLLVEPGNAADSYLYIKIVGGDRIAEGTLRMPIGRDLTPAQIDLVRNWIDDGAER
ncbi:MAG: hypothetical protein WD423_03490 [Rhodothermales bacterium]